MSTASTPPKTRNEWLASHLNTMFKYRIVPTQAMILLVLGEKELDSGLFGKMLPREIEQRIHELDRINFLSRATIHHSLVMLCTKKLIQRKLNLENRTATSYYLTKKGKFVLDAIFN